MTTYAQLQAAIARDVHDVDLQTFLADEVKDLAQSALAEVGRLAPFKFREDVTPLANTLDYQLQAAVFPNETPEIEVRRVEIWDATVAPERFYRLVQPATAQPTSLSDGGWECWNGVLSIPYRVLDFMDLDNNFLRVWGYRPYAVPSDDADVIECSNEQEQAVRAFAKVEALAKLLQSRDLFTQWQTRSNNSDISPAGLMNQLSLAREDWRRRARALTVLREN